MLNVTEQAQAKIKEFLSAQNGPNLVRVYIQGYG